MPDQCSNCAFVRARTYGTKQVLECRLIEPRVPQGQKGQWPEVLAADWCGEYKAPGYTATYLQGSGNSSDVTRRLLLSKSGDAIYSAVELEAIQITNRATAKDVIVVLYDGDTTAAIGTAGCAQAASANYTYLPGIRTTAGNDLWWALAEAGGPVYVSAQGHKRRVGG